MGVINMNYSLNSKRKIGTETQQITTLYCNSNKTQEETLTFLKNIHTTLNTLNYYQTGGIIYTSFMQQPSEKHNNVGNTYRITFTVKNNKTAEPKFYQLTLGTQADYSIINERIIQAFDDLTGNSITDSDYFITNINIIFEE